MSRGPRRWCPSPSSAQLPLGRGGLGCHDLVDGIGRPAAGPAAARPRGRAGGGGGGGGAGGGAAVLDVTISLRESAGLRPAWPRRAIAIARAGVAVVAVAASGDGSACPSVPGDRAISGAAGAGAAGRGQQRQAFVRSLCRGRLGTAAWPGVRTDGEVCHGRPGRMSPGLVMAGTGGRAGPEGCWVAWTTTALSRSGICGGATAARVAGVLMRSGG